MKRAGARLSLCLAALIAMGGVEPAVFAQTPEAEIVVAQNNRESLPGFFRRLFKRQPREVAPDPRQQEAPLFRRQRGEPEAVAPPRERRERRARRQPAPAPVEVAAVEKAADAKRVLAVGDFMAGALAKGLAEAYRDNPNVVVIDASNGSSGLVRSDYYDWPGKLAELVEAQKPDAILVLIGANDRQTIGTDTGKFALGSDEWRTAYTARVAALADALKQTAKPTLWLGLAPVSSGAMSRDYSAFNGIVREQLEAKSLRFIETWNGFANEDGKYVSVGPDVSGQSVQLRNSDGLNFTRAGQRKLAYYVEQDLNDLLGGIGSLLAAADPTAATVTPDVTAPQIGPMVPLDALSAAGGDALSGGAPVGASGEAENGVAASIAERLVGEKAATPPTGRADSYLWPLPPPKPVPAAAPAAVAAPGAAVAPAAPGAAQP